MKTFTLIVGALLILALLLGAVWLLVYLIVDKLKELREEKAKHFIRVHLSELRDYCSYEHPIIKDVVDRALDATSDKGAVCYSTISNFRDELRRKYPNERTARNVH